MKKLFLLILLITSLLAQKKNFTYEEAFEGKTPKIFNQLPVITEWLDDQFYLEKGDKVYKVNALSGDREEYFDYKLLESFYIDGLTKKEILKESADKLKFILSKGNDLYYINRIEKICKKLTNDRAEEKNPEFSPDLTKIAYTKNNDLYVYSIKDSKEIRITNDGSDVVYNGWASWVYYEEIIGRRSNYSAFYWSPDSRNIAFLRFDDTNVPKFYLTNADGIHGELEVQRYPKPGDPNPKVKLGVYSLDKNKTVWANTDENLDQYIAFPFWAKDSKFLLFQWMNRTQDKIEINLMNINDGSYKNVYTETQRSWVEWFNDLYLLENNDFLIKSNIDGWDHIYRISIDGKVNQITKGNWKVQDLFIVNEKDKKIYFTANKENYLELHPYSIKLDGKDMQRLSDIPGTHTVIFSKTGKYFIDRYSNINTPAKIELRDTKKSMVKSIADSYTEEINNYAFGKTELFTVPSGDGYNLPVKWILPADFNPEYRYPVIISVYGGPDAGSVRNTYNSYLSSHFYTQNNILYIEMDHRGGGQYGKKSVAEMHRNLGKYEMLDYITIVKWLKKKSFVDTTKIGITGGSYGGYATFMALTYGSEHFTHGIANFGVTDWRLYDNVYTERYMDTPFENPEGYKTSSVFTYADKLKGKLLITHGTLDDNVHMQNTIQLIDKLENLNKRFELMLYPNERHGYRAPKRNHFAKEQVNFWFRNFLNKEIK